MLIGKAAKKASVGVETMRFYQRQGLIDEPPRSADGGYRQYSMEFVHHIRFIRSVQKLGFCLQDIKELLKLEAATDTGCADVQERARDKLAVITARIEHLLQIKSVLERLIAACPGHGPTRDCSILNEIKRGELQFAAVEEGDKDEQK